MQGITQQVANFLTNYSSLASDAYFTDVSAQWMFYTNTTDENGDASAAADAVLSDFQRAWAGYATSNFTSLSGIDNSSANNYQQRQLKMIETVGIDLETNDTETLSGYINQMNSKYNHAVLCQYKNQSCDTNNPNQTWKLDPDLFDRLAKSRDYDELTYIWKGWRDQLKTNRAIYQQFVPLSNKGAVRGGFKDTVRAFINVTWNKALCGIFRGIGGAFGMRMTSL